MARRSYQQHCGLAAALDVVGRRWALLVIRDLAPGPRRFTDLFAGLPGISTDMLAQRLRELEEAGAVDRVERSHPAPVVLYQLTERGRELARIATDLAEWGGPMLSDPGEHRDRLHPRWALQTIAARYRGGSPDGVVHVTIRAGDGGDDGGGDEDGGGEVGGLAEGRVRTVDLGRDEALTLRLAGERATLRYGHSAEQPQLVVACTAADFFALGLEPGLIDPVEERPGIQVDGNVDLLVELLGLLSPRAPRSRAVG